MGRLDTGADAILLTESTGMSLNYHTKTVDPVTIVFGNNTTAKTTTAIEVGNYPALICKDVDLGDNLISVNPFLDNGFQLLLTKDYGHLLHPPTGEKVALHSDGIGWLVNIEDIAALNIGPIKTQADTTLQEYFAQRAKTSSKLPLSGLRQRVIQLHERMGHASMESMCKAITGSAPSWVNTYLTETQVRKVMRKDPCLVCILGKRNKQPTPLPSGSHRECTAGEVISADIVGKITPSARKGEQWIFLFADVATGYQHTFISHTKDGFITALSNVVNFYKSHSLTVKVLRTDSEAVLLSKDILTYLETNKIFSEHSIAYTHNQNFVERYVQTLTKGVSVMLHSQRFLPAQYWDLALFHYVACRNRTPNAKTGTTTPLSNGC